MILGFDTSTAHVGAALLDGGTLAAAAHEEMGRGQAERLFPMLEDLLAEADAGWSDVHAIGVGVGPGNFTGIRLSVAAARGLALSLGIPAVGVSTLEALAFGTQGPVTALVAAPRDQVYMQHFNQVAQSGAPLLCPLDEIADRRLPDPTWIGAHARDGQDLLGGTAADPIYPLAEAIARIAATRWQQAPSRPAPLYLKAADAAPSRDAPPAILE